MKALENLLDSDPGRQSRSAMAGGFLAMALAFAAALAPALAAAQAQELNNPLNRNPRNRTGIADSAPVYQDPRNSSTRPTQPAASRKPDPRDTVPAPDPSRDVPPTALGGTPPDESAALFDRWWRQGGGFTASSMNQKSR